MPKQDEKDIEQVVLSAEAIQHRVKELAAEVSRDYQGLDLHLVTILKGALVFLADFSRALTIQATFDFMVVSSYDGIRTSGEVQILKDLNRPIRSRHVLLIEDILDHGNTLSTLMKALILRQPASLKVCTLFSKSSPKAAPITPDYNGFVIPDAFVVGYGLDYREKYRDLPYIGTLRKEVYQHL